MIVLVKYKENQGITCYLLPAATLFVPAVGIVCTSVVALLEKFL